MSWGLELFPSARKGLRAIPRDVRERIAARIDGLVDDPRPRDARSLMGSMRGLRRLRVGEYRVVYRLDEVRKVVTVTDIAHGHDAYH